MRSQTHGAVRRGDRPVRRHRLRLAVLAVGTAGGLVTLFHYDATTSVSAVPVAGAAGDLGQAAEAPAAQAPAAQAPAAQAPAVRAGTPSAAAGTPGRASRASGQARTATGKPAAQTVVGDPADTRWGVVQVKLTVRDGKIVSAGTVESPHSSQRSLEINARALPILNAEVVQAQSGTVDAVSGATVTSGGYRTSLQSALDKAHLG